MQVMCTSSVGDHPFNITWHKDARRLFGFEQKKQLQQHQLAAAYTHDFDEHTVEITEIPPFSSILSIHNISSPHNGNYTCQISNVAGAAEYTAVLWVAGNGFCKLLPFLHFINCAYTCVTHNAPF